MNRERKELLLGKIRVAERFHPLHIFRAGGKGELAAAFAVAEAAVKAHDSSIAAQLEVNGGILGGGETGIEAREVAEFVRVAPSL